MTYKRHSSYKTFLAIIDYQRAHGYVPSIRDLCTATGINSTSLIRRHLQALEEEGLIARAAGKARAIRVVARDGAATVEAGQ